MRRHATVARYTPRPAESRGKALGVSLGRQRHLQAAWSTWRAGLRPCPAAGRLRPLVQLQACGSPGAGGALRRRSILMWVTQA